MPSRNLVKPYLAGGYYHVYNRGVNRDVIFRDDRDYLVFLQCLKSYLGLAAAQSQRARPKVDLSNEVALLAYCLMPNHYHLLIQQYSVEGMTRLMRRVMTSYAMYFNRRYERTGPLCQAYFKAALVDTDAYLMHVSRYIHLNPSETEDPSKYRFSSLNDYLRESPTWINTRPVLSLFESRSKYRSFVFDRAQTPDVTQVAPASQSYLQ